MPSGLRYASLVLILQFVALSAAANVVDVRAPGVEGARAELIRFNEELRDIAGMDPVVAETARADLAAAPPEVILSVHALFEQVQGWRELPRVAADLSRAVDEQQMAQLQMMVKASVRGPAAVALPMDAESQRQILLSVVAFFRALTPVAGAESDQKWADLQAMIETAKPDSLPMLADGFASGMDRFREGVSDGDRGGRLRAQTNVDCGSYCCETILGVDVCIPGCTSFCDWVVGAVTSAVNATIAGLRATQTFLENQVAGLRAQITGYINQIADLANQVANWANTIAQFVNDAITATGNLFTQIGNLVTQIGTTFANLYTGISTAITGFFNELIALVPTTPQAAFALLTGIDLSDTSWIDTLVARFPVLEAPCPDIGADAGPLGIVGTLAAAQKSDGFAKLTKIFYDAAPKDVAGMKIKLAIAAIYHPAEYWNLCARSRYAISEWDKETAHRALLTGNLNVPLSTRGTLVSGRALSASVSEVDHDVAFAAGKLDLLAPKSDELLRRLDAPLSTRVRQTSVDTLRGTLGNIDQNVAVVESKLDVLQSNVRLKARHQSERQVMLAAFEELMTRLSVEDNLLAGNVNVVSTYQLPEAFGGQLGLVRSIVEKTIAAMLAAGQSANNAQRELEIGNALVPVGDFGGAFKQFRKAYGEAVKP